MQHEPNVTRQWRDPVRLTPAEGELIVTMVVHNCSLINAASLLGIKRKTAENRSREIRNKTGFRTIDEVVAELNSNPRMCVIG